MKERQTLMIVGLVFVAGLMRLWIDVPNFSPIGAMALMGGFYFRKKTISFLLPFLALFISDAVLALNGGTYANYFLSQGMAVVYISFGLIVFIGKRMSNDGMLQTFLGSLAGSITFFLITNAAAWYGSPMYPQNFQGLIESYTAGLAFYRQGFLGNFFLNFLMGTVLFSTAISLSAKVLTPSKKTAVA